MMQVRIEDMVKGGGQAASEAESCNIVMRCQMSKVSYLQTGSRACLRVMEAFAFCSAQLYILLLSGDTFSLISDFNTKKFPFALFEKSYVERNKAGQFLNFNYKKHMAEYAYKSRLFITVCFLY